jgi:hypothetical protein
MCLSVLCNVFFTKCLCNTVRYTVSKSDFTLMNGWRNGCRNEEAIDNENAFNLEEKHYDIPAMYSLLKLVNKSINIIMAFSCWPWYWEWPRTCLRTAVMTLAVASGHYSHPQACNRANGCLILSIKSKHRLPNFQLVFHQLFWLDPKTGKYFSIKTSPQALRNVWIRFSIMDLQSHKYIYRQNQSTTGNCANRNDPDLVQACLKQWWVESDFKVPNLPLSLRLKGSGCH